MKSPRMIRLFVASCLALSMTPMIAAAEANASAYPAKPIRIVVPFGAGSVTDTLARVVGNKLGEAWSQPVVVDNRAGADGNIGTGFVAAADPDGYTLLFGAASTNAVNPSLHGNLKFNAIRDFVPVANVASVPNVLVVHPGVPARNVKDLIELLRKNSYAYASGGAGGSQHLSAELFKTMSKTDMLHVPYKGGAPALTDLLSGRVQLMFCNLPLCLQQIRAGKLVALGVTSAKRTPLLPDVPTIAEAGVPGYVVDGWFGLFAPKGVPEAIVKRLNAEVDRILQEPDVRKQLLDQGAVPNAGSAQQFARFVRAEHDRWATVIRQANIKVD